MFESCGVNVPLSYTAKQPEIKDMWVNHLHLCYTQEVWSTLNTY
jgi:hypothetical protein